MKEKNDPAIGAVLGLIAEAFPKCFFVYEKRRRPLKVGIHADLLAAFDGAVTATELSNALRVYVANRVYRSKLTAGATRIGLDGQPAGVVTPEQATPPSPPRPRPQSQPQPVSGAAAPVRAVVSSKQPKRLSLSDLRAAGKQRRAKVVA